MSGRQYDGLRDFMGFSSRPLVGRPTNSVVRISNKRRGSRWGFELEEKFPNHAHNCEVPIKEATCNPREDFELWLKGSGLGHLGLAVDRDGVRSCAAPQVSSRVGTAACTLFRSRASCRPVATTCEPQSQNPRRQPSSSELP